ncbi:MAG: hypothetical protein R6V21_13235, partial [Pelovirga sp.]
MKNLVKIMMVMAALLVLGVGQVWAYSFDDVDGSDVKLQLSSSGAEYGDYKVFDSNGSLLFNTFCVEKSVGVYANTLYYSTVDEGVKTSQGGSVSVLNAG